MKRQIVLMAVIWVAALGTQAQAAEVHVNVNIGAPPPIIVHSAPRMVYLAQPAVYVAVGVPYDLYFVGGRYYYARGDNWFWSPRHGGPWNRVVYRSLPPGLQRFQVARLREFRDREYYAFRAVDRGHGKGRGNGHRKH